MLIGYPWDLREIYSIIGYTRGRPNYSSTTGAYNIPGSFGDAPSILHTPVFSEYRVHIVRRVLRVLQYGRAKFCEYWEYERY